MKIIVLGGGNSPERDVSIRSSNAVATACSEAGFGVERVDPMNGFSFLDSVPKDAIIFPILHGAEGEDGVIQHEFETRNLMYLGSDSAVSKVCFDKNLTRQKLEQAGVDVAEGDSVTKDSYAGHPLATRPHVLKAQRGGSSIGTYLVRDPNALDQSKVNEVFALDSQAIIEELVEGIEITVPVLDGVALPVIEIVPPTDGEFDYENKYNGMTKEIVPAISIDESAQKRAQAIAEKVHTTLGCRHLSRVDIIVRMNGEMVVLEANTMPGMTDQSLYPKSAKVAGYPMPELMKKFIELIKRDYKLGD